jgi:hypothetical protein
MADAVDVIRRFKFLYLDSILEPEENTLRLVIAEAGDGGPSDPTKFKDEGPELQRILSESREIAHLPGMLKFELLWNSYIAYSVRNESFVSRDDYEQFEGRLLVTYTKSRYLDFVSAATFASPDYPGSFTHWGVFCLNHIVDIVSVEPPQIRRADV